MVTTFNAGMAVPDWPSTYGYNLLLYPWETWVLGPWDLFIEHGHRLLGALVGLLTIVFVAVVFRFDRRPWMRILALGALAGVIAQGVLGGARVLLDARTLAMIHACVGPAFFALCVALAVFTSRRWREAAGLAEAGRVARFQRVGLITLALSYVQILLGAQLRHVPLDASPYSFRTLVIFHVAMALVLAGHAAALAILAVIGQAGEPSLGRSAMLLAALLALQIALGAGTWVVNYSWPDWDNAFPFAAGYTIEAEGVLQTNVATSHVAVGSLILGIATQLAVRGMRLLRPASPPAGASARTLEAAA
jgi:cytochrome c oxidase assembly protein subunit 15